MYCIAIFVNINVYDSIEIRIIINFS